MNSAYLQLLLWTAAISSGLMAGTYLAFSSFIMRSLATMPPKRAVAAMNAINTTILKSSFMPLFFGSTIVSVLLIVVGLWHLNEPGGFRALAAGTIYLLGMFVVTAARNVPLNNALASVSGDDDQAQRAWHAYRPRWTGWNTVRTLASMATLILCINLLSLPHWP